MLQSALSDLYDVSLTGVDHVNEPGGDVVIRQQLHSALRGAVAGVHVNWAAVYAFKKTDWGRER